MIRKEGIKKLFLKNNSRILQRSVFKIKTNLKKIKPIKWK